MMMLTNTIFDTHLGKMLAVSSEVALYSLSFVDQRNNKTGFDIDLNTLGETKISTKIQTELHAYFYEKEYVFRTPVVISGTDFQNKVWNVLKAISPGETQSYSQIAEFIHQPSAVRAVANAIGKNPFSIVIPCHRVVGKNGELGGYNAGLDRKKWLLAHERLS